MTATKMLLHRACHVIWPVEWADTCTEPWTSNCWARVQCQQTDCRRKFKGPFICFMVWRLGRTLNIMVTKELRAVTHLDNIKSKQAERVENEKKQANKVLLEKTKLEREKLQLSRQWNLYTIIWRKQKQSAMLPPSWDWTAFKRQQKPKGKNLLILIKRHGRLRRPCWRCMLYFVGTTLEAKH